MTLDGTTINEVLEILGELRNELKELRLLYRELVDRLIPVEEPEVDEQRAIEEEDEVVSEEDLLRVLREANRD